MSKNTMIEMVTELEKLTPAEHVKKVIDTAKAGQFHDWRSSAVCGKMYAVECLEWLLKTPGLNSEDIVRINFLRSEIINGEYDEKMTEEDRAHVIAEAEADESMSDRDKAFFIAAFGGKTKDNRSGFGKRYF
jgi:hypothetical protein